MEPFGRPRPRLGASSALVGAIVVYVVGLRESLSVMMLFSWGRRYYRYVCAFSSILVRNMAAERHRVYECTIESMLKKHFIVFTQFKKKRDMISPQMSQ